MTKARSSTKNTMINVICSVGVLIVNICISFFLSPFIIKTLGVEANGFVNLANNFVSYANMIVTALNAMAIRFITLAYVKKDYEKANLYYNSVFWGNLIIVVLLLVPAILVIFRLEIFINISRNLTSDVKILFAMVFLAFFAKTAAPNWDCGTSVTNRMDLTYIPSMLLAIFRGCFLFIVLSFFTPRIWMVSLASLLVTLMELAVGYRNTHVLTPELKVSIKKRICSIKAIIELVGSGIWNSISTVGNTLLSGLDLLICNISIGATEMGILSVSKVIPNLLIQLSESIRSAFAAEMMINYAKGDKVNMELCIRRAMKIMSVVVTIPTAGIVVMSDALYALWVPSQDAHLLQVLSILAILNYIFTSGVAVLFNIFTIANKVRYNSIAMILSGVLSVLITLAIVELTDFDLYAVAGVSSIVTILKNVLFVLPVTAKLVGFKWYKFYPQVGTSLLCSGLIILVGVVVRLVIPTNTWILFFVACTIIGSLGLGINLIIVLNNEERKFLFNLVKRKIKK